jgi:hypothetical protein
MCGWFLTASSLRFFCDSSAIACPDLSNHSNRSICHKRYQIAQSSHIAQIAPYAIPGKPQLGDNFVRRGTRVCVIFEKQKLTHRSNCLEICFRLKHHFRPTSDVSRVSRVSGKCSVSRKHRCRSQKRNIIYGGSLPPMRSRNNAQA